jgi:hypothetical protein
MRTMHHPLHVYLISSFFPPLFLRYLSHSLSNRRHSWTAMLPDDSHIQPDQWFRDWVCKVRSHRAVCDYPIIPIHFYLPTNPPLSCHPVLSVDRTTQGIIPMLLVHDSPSSADDRKNHCESWLSSCALAPANFLVPTPTKIHRSPRLLVQSLQSWAHLSSKYICNQEWKGPTGVYMLEISSYCTLCHLPTTLQPFYPLNGCCKKNSPLAFFSIKFPGIASS